MQAPVPGGEHQLPRRKKQGGGQVQGINAAQVVGERELFPAASSTARSVSTYPMRHMYQPSADCIAVRIRSLPS